MSNEPIFTQTIICHTHRTITIGSQLPQNYPRMKLAWLIKPSVQVALLFMFFYFFGQPSIQRYLDKKVIVTAFQEDHEHLEAPSLTICPMKPYQNITSPSYEVVEQICDQKGGEDISRCIEDATPNLTSLVDAISNGESADIEKMAIDNKDWTTDFTVPHVGVCFTFDSPFTLGLLAKNKSLLVWLHANVQVVAFIHDPNFFVINFNPLMPFTSIIIDEDLFNVYPFTVVQHHKYDSPSKPCSMEPSYSFTDCVKTALSKEAG